MSSCVVLCFTRLPTQEQMEDMKRKEEKTDKHMAEVMSQNRRMTEPLQRTREEVALLQKQLAHYEKDKASLAVCVATTHCRPVPHITLT